MKEKGKTPESFSKDDVCAASTVRRAVKRGTISIQLAQRIAGYLEVPVASFADIDVALTYPVNDVPATLGGGRCQYGSPREWPNMLSGERERTVTLTYPVIDMVDRKTTGDIALAIRDSIEKMSKKEKDDRKNAGDVGLAIRTSMERNVEKQEDDGKDRKEVKMGKYCKRKKKLKKKIAKLSGYWGTLMPTLAMEECGELIQAISKVERGLSFSFEQKEMVYSESTLKNLAEEMADVLIAVEAIRVYYGIDEKDIVLMMEKKARKKF